MDFSNLPEEILPTIFQYLPVDDRKNVRLTSHAWNRGCNRWNIIRDEKFVIRFDKNKDNIGEIAISIANCETFRSDFEFQGFPLSQLPSNVWKCCGYKIESLLIFECEVDNETIGSILLYCSNLSRFYLESSLNTEFCSENILDDLIKRNVVHRSLFSFQLYIYAHVSNEIYRKLFHIYPSIRIFGIGHRDLCCSSEAGMELPLMTDSFIYKCDTDGLWMVPFCSNSKLTFKNLRVHFYFTSENNYNVVKDFFSSQTELEKIELSFDHVVAEEVKAIMFLILRNCSKLKDFQLHMECGIFLSSPELGNFLEATSRLNSLRLSVGVKEEFRVDSSCSVQLLRTLPWNKLTKLRLSFYNKQIYKGILNHCFSLHYLHLENISMRDRTLQNVLEKHRQLRTLRVHFRDESSRGSHLSEAVTVHSHILPLNLPSHNHLKHLEIRGLMQRWDADDNVFDAFSELLSKMDFPNLRYFHFEPHLCKHKEVVYKMLDIVSRKIPSLEMLKLDSPLFLAWGNSDLLNGSEVMSYCRRLKKLKSLIINPFFPQEHYRSRQHPIEQLFIECPSLSYVSGYGRKYGPNLVFYDRFSRTLKWYKHFKHEMLKWNPHFTVAKVL